MPKLLTDPLLIPVQRFEPQKGQFYFPDSLRVATPLPRHSACLKRIRAAGKALGCSIHFLAGIDLESDIRCIQRPMPSGPDSYQILIQPDGIQLAAATPAGWFYGFHTLADLMELGNRHVSAGCIDDAPHFKRRGIYLDCSRGKVPTVNTLIDLIQQLGAWKINELQLYVENVFSFRKHPSFSRGYSPFTPQDLLDLQEACKKNFISFVPSLASFGHFERILSLPAYASLGEKPGHWGYPGGTTLCPTDHRSIELVSDMYDEFLPLFEAVDFNACCDETWELGKGRSAKACERKGIGSVYLDFVLNLYALCERHGKRMNIWGDIVLNHPEIIPQVPQDIVMLNWDYGPNGARMAQTHELTEADLPTLICPGTNAWGSHGSRYHMAFPCVSDFAAIGRQHHVEGLLMTDWGDQGHRNTLGVSLASYAWAAAFAWGEPGSQSRFLSRFCQQYFAEDAETAYTVLNTLGSSEKHVGDAHLYYSFTSSLTGKDDLYRGIRPRSTVYLQPPARQDFIAKTKPAPLRRVIQHLDALPSFRSGAALPRFWRHTIQDLQLAVQMDGTACRRILAGHAVRKTGNLPAGQRRELVDLLQSMSSAFEKNWHLRNRPSRLNDNLQIMNHCIQEAKML